MIIILLIAVSILMIFSVFVRTILLNPIKTITNFPVDIYHYFRYKLFNQMETGKLICYTALFGGGKTLSCVHHVIKLYDRYNNKKIYDPVRKKWLTQKVHIISNVDITRPFERFTSLAQIIRAAEKFKEIDEKNNTRTCTVVLGDEFSVQMNSRSFKTNIDPQFLNTLLTCRHHHIMLIYNAQRFNHVDKLLRDVTTTVIECKKIWRVCVQKTYDAWQLENCQDPTTVKAQARHGWFITNQDYNNYDTLACVGNLIKAVKDGDMESEIEIINRLQPREYDFTEGRHRRRVERGLKRR